MARGSDEKSSFRRSERSPRKAAKTRGGSRARDRRDDDFDDQYEDDAPAPKRRGGARAQAKPSPASKAKGGSRPAASRSRASAPGTPKGFRPRNRVARAWRLERRRRAESRGAPLRIGRKLLAGLGLLATVFFTTAWLGGFAEDAAGRANYSMRAAFADAGFTLAHVEVRGAERAAAAEVAERLMLEPGELIFNFDPAAAKARVEELAWVSEAAVIRLLPDRVVVIVDERRPLARWRSTDGAVFVLDDAGAVIPGVDASEYGNLPLVEGEDAPEAARGLVSALGAYPVLARRASGFERVGGRRWDMTTYTGLTVRLPEGEEAAALAALLALHEEDSVLDLPLSVLDMRGADLVMRPRALSRRTIERGA
ncbi:MAG: FtsQ-type POTRA domain-containing protein [Maricaulaceae bacterium]